MTDFILPDIGEGIVECELIEWLVAEGDHIVEDQPVAEVMTDKAMVQIPAMHSGVVTKLYYAKGDIAKVHSPLFAMQLEGEESLKSAPVAADEEPAKAESSNSEVKQEAPVSAPAVSTGHIEDFILPDIGEGIVECELVEWLVAEGDSIKEDQPVAEVMTDKAMVQIPAKHDGVVVKLHYAKGDIAKVHTPLFALQIQGEATQQEPQPSVQPEVTKVEPSTTSAAVNATLPTVRSGKNGKALASPAVRRLAREQNIDIHSVTGSGPKGRVMKDDITRFAKGETSAVMVSAQPKVTGGKRVEAIRGIKAAMAKQMVESVSTIPHFTVSDEIDMDALMAARSQLKDGFAAQGIKLSYMPFVIKALSNALKQFPIINSQVNADCTELTYFDDHNIGVAIDSKIGLLVPNIKGVQNMSLNEIARELNRLIDLGREGRLSKDDLTGGTISISNVGVIGGTTATPVINKPEVAIVALGKIQTLPRFDAQGHVKAANIMHISWSGDHRVIDGATMVRFSNVWKGYLENPFSMFSTLA